MGYAAGDLNLYRYVGDSPTRNVDPCGLLEYSASSGSVANWSDPYEMLIPPYAPSGDSPFGLIPPWSPNANNGDVDCSAENKRKILETYSSFCARRFPSSDDILHRESVGADGKRAGYGSESDSNAPAVAQLERGRAGRHSPGDVGCGEHRGSVLRRLAETLLIVRPTLFSPLPFSRGVIMIRCLAATLFVWSLLVTPTGLLFADDNAYDVGVRCCQQGQFRTAKEHFREVARESPQKGLKWFAFTLLLSGDATQSVAEFGNAMRLNPRDASLYYGRAVARELLGEYVNAVADLDESLRLDSSDLAVASMRVDLMIRVNDTRVEEAVESLTALYASSAASSKAEAEAWMSAISTYGQSRKCPVPNEITLRGSGEDSIPKSRVSLEGLETMWSCACSTNATIH